MLSSQSPRLFPNSNVLLLLDLSHLDRSRQHTKTAVVEMDIALHVNLKCWQVYRREEMWLMSFILVWCFETQNSFLLRQAVLWHYCLHLCWVQKCEQRLCCRGAGIETPFQQCYLRKHCDSLSSVLVAGLHLRRIQYLFYLTGENYTPAINYIEKKSVWTHLFPRKNSIYITCTIDKKCFPWIEWCNCTVTIYFRMWHY